MVGRHNGYIYLMWAAMLLMLRTIVLVAKEIDTLIHTVYYVSEFVRQKVTLIPFRNGAISFNVAILLLKSSNSRTLMSLTSNMLLKFLRYKFILYPRIYSMMFKIATFI